MSKSKHIDKICVAVFAVMILLTLLFMNGTSFGLSLSDQTMGYEKRLFDTETVHNIDIVMDDWDSFIESCENEQYAACTVLIDGEKYSNIAIRAKGNTSLSSVKAMGSQRYSFKLEFDQYEKGKSYYGLDKLCLNNLIQDNTMMKDYLSYQLMYSFGVDAPLCSYVYITVNGEDWGLYLAVEGVEDSFLKRNYGSETGELYKPDSISFGGGRGNGKNFDRGDFEFEEGEMPQMPEEFEEEEMPQIPGGFKDRKRPDDVSQEEEDGSSGMTLGKFPQRMDAEGEMPQMPEGFEGGEMPEMPGGFGGKGSDDVKLKYVDDDPDSYPNIFDNAKTDVSGADQKRLIAALKNLSEGSDLENTLDVGEVLRYFVVHNYLVNGDSYTGSMIHNYYLHEKDGKLSMIPWDYNLAFGTFHGGSASSSVNASIDDPVSGSMEDRPMVSWIFSDEKYTEQYHEFFSEFTEEWIDSGRLEQMIEDTAAMIRPYVEKDPTKFCTTEEYETGVRAIIQFTALRGEAVKRQLQGDDTAVDAGGLNTSDMGTMNNGMGDKAGGKGGFAPPS